MSHQIQCNSPTCRVCVCLFVCCACKWSNHMRLIMSMDWEQTRLRYTVQYVSGVLRYCDSHNKCKAAAIIWCNATTTTPTTRTDSVKNGSILFLCASHGEALFGAEYARCFDRSDGILGRKTFYLLFWGRQKISLLFRLLARHSLDDWKPLKKKWYASACYWKVNYRKAWKNRITVHIHQNFPDEIVYPFYLHSGFFCRYFVISIV